MLLVDFEFSAVKVFDTQLILVDSFVTHLRTKQNSIARIVSVVLKLVTINFQDFPIVTSNYWR